MYKAKKYLLPLPDKLNIARLLLSFSFILMLVSLYAQTVSSG